MQGRNVSVSSVNVTQTGEKTRLVDVARAAGVSIATASKAINGRADVSAATRRKVLAAASEVGYQSGTHGNAEYPLIALVADELITTYTLEVIRGAATAAIEGGVGLLTLYTPLRRKEGVPVPLTDEWFDLLRTRHFVGVIVVTAELSERQLAKAQQTGIELVVIDPANPLPATATSIGSTNWNGGVEATQHLIDLGHRRIAYVGGPEKSVPSRERYQGYLSGMAMNGITPEPNLVRGSDYSRESGLKAATELLGLPSRSRPTAIFAVADNAALGVYEAARRMGMSVPEDLSVVGFDDSLIARNATPGLTTIHQSLEGMGSTAVRTLIDRAAGRPTTVGPIRLATHLVVRESSAPPLTR